MDDYTIFQGAYISKDAISAPVSVPRINMGITPHQHASDSMSMGDGIITIVLTLAALGAAIVSVAAFVSIASAF